MGARFSRSAVLVACVCALALVGTAPALAQTDAPTNETADPTEPDEQITDQLGDLVIHDYNFNDGEMMIEATWRGNTPETVTLVEMIELDSGGSADISFQRQRLIPDDRTEITIAAEERAGGTAAVMVTTPQSIDAGQALVLQDGEPSDWPTIGLDSAVLATGLSAAGASALTFVFVLRRKHAEERGVSRKA